MQVLLARLVDHFDRKHDIGRYFGAPEEEEHHDDLLNDRYYPNRINPFESLHTR